jgi:hypothetical protein
MSQNVRLRVDKYLEGETLENGALVEIRALEPSGRSRLIEKVPVPVGESSSFSRSVDLAPGRYELTAYMPSGELLSQTLDLAEQPGDVEVVLRGEHSPHEWLSWQHLLGNVAGRADLNQRISTRRISTRSVVIKPPGSYAVPGEPEGYAENAENPEITAKLWLVPPAPIDPLWTRLDVWLAQLAPGKPLDLAQLFPPGAEARGVQIINDPPYAAARLDLGAHVGDRRAYLICSRGSEAILCAMPYPWMQSDGSGEAQVEASIAIDVEGLESSPIENSLVEEPGWSVRPGVRDRQLGSVLSYLSSGEAASARELIQPARELLFEKTINPMAAAGGGYVLVDEWVRDSSQAGSDSRWHSWIDNLANWFPWLPDGAILQGWLALRRRDQAPDLGKARSALLQAESRGIPLYTAGVRRLSDGLMLLANEARGKGSPDPEVDAAMARVRRLAWQVDPRQPFTCVRLTSS